MPPSQSLESFLHALETPVKQQRNHILLLVRPSDKDYIQTLESIYNYLQYEPPVDLKQSELNKNVLNYTYIKQDEEEEPVEGCFEIYTIYDPALEDLSQTKDLLSLLDDAASDIDVLIFIDSMEDNLAQIVNSAIDDDSDTDEEIKKNRLIPQLHRLVDPFFDLNDNVYQWKSCTVLVTNVSKWIYKAMTISVIDFLQQFLRSLLLESFSNSETSRMGFLIYFPFEIADSKEKMRQIWTNLMPLDKSTSLQPLADATFSETPIKYNDIFTDSREDTFRNISLLDDSFDWSLWMSYWNSNV